MKHFSHEHPLVLSKYNNSPPDIFCYVCNDPILINTCMYHCIHRSITTQDSPCTHFFLHKTCAELPMIIQHHLHPQHVLTFQQYSSIRPYCEICHHDQFTFFYKCSICEYNICFKCAPVEREINHPSHNHALTLLPFRAILDICTACGTEGSKDFSYLCQPCSFWIHKSCASAPPTLTRKDHHNDHPLVLAYSLPKEYRRYQMSCSLCHKKVDWFYWLYYCAICRYFAHVQCALSAPEYAFPFPHHFFKDGEESDEGSNAMHFPVSENELYQLIQQFAKNFTTISSVQFGKADVSRKCHNGHPLTLDVIRECRNGHPLTLFDDFNSNNLVETNTSDKRICDGCVLPLLSTPDPFYGCVECNFFLHNVCAAELPREIQHSFHPKEERTRFTRCYPTSKPLEFHFCNFCCRYFNGIGYSSDSCWIDVVCAALPSKIKHDSHRHTLQLLSDTDKERCRGCGDSLGDGPFFFSNLPDLSFGCQKCGYYIHIKCALKPGTIKHRWDEHEVNLVYPPVKGHPHDFDCEFCSKDINPNYWFYHCSKCDTSFHADCIYPNGGYYIMKYGRIIRDDSLHQHNLKFTITGRNYPRYKCGRCGGYKENYRWKYKCESCKFSVCKDCFVRHTHPPIRLAGSDTIRVHLMSIID